MRKRKREPCERGIALLGRGRGGWIGEFRGDRPQQGTDEVHAIMKQRGWSRQRFREVEGRRG